MVPPIGRETPEQKALHDGWFYSGDLARVGEDWYFSIVDRKKHMVISVGENAYPAEADRGCANGSGGLEEADRIRSVADDEFLQRFAQAVAGTLGGKVGAAPRLFLRKLVDVLDTIELHPDFDPYTDYEVSIAASELSDAECEVVSVDDVELEL